jgi:hypothetical protein
MHRMSRQHLLLLGAILLLALVVAFCATHQAGAQAPAARLDASQCRHAPTAFEAPPPGSVDWCAEQRCLEAAEPCASAQLGSERAAECRALRTQRCP